MKVRQLIRELKKMDPNAEVGWQSHDQSEDELDGWVRVVSEGSVELLEREGLKAIVVLGP